MVVDQRYNPHTDISNIDSFNNQAPPTPQLSASTNSQSTSSLISGPLHDPAPPSPISSASSHETTTDHRRNRNKDRVRPFIHRRKTSPEQLDRLIQVFHVLTQVPDLAMRKRLAEEVGMTERAIQVWFQNRRAKMAKVKADKMIRERRRREVEIENNRLALMGEAFSPIGARTNEHSALLTLPSTHPLQFLLHSGMPPPNTLPLPPINAPLPPPRQEDQSETVPDQNKDLPSMTNKISYLTSGAINDVMISREYHDTDAQLGRLLDQPGMFERQSTFFVQSPAQIPNYPTLNLDCQLNNLFGQEIFPLHAYYQPDNL
jgi:hypothetical protein